MRNQNKRFIFVLDKQLSTTLKIKKMNTPQTFRIENRTLVQLPSTPNSGNFKFKDVTDGEIYLYEKNELSKELVAQLDSLTFAKKEIEKQYFFNVTRINKKLYSIKTNYTL